MNLQEKRYQDYALVRDMMQTAAVIRGLDVSGIQRNSVKSRRIFLTGEGSSRLFPAKRLIAEALQRNYRQVFATAGGEQAADYTLEGWMVFAASNSGKTAEIVGLLRRLKEAAHPDLFAIGVQADTPIMEAAHRTYPLTCGPEGAVAATKTVVEQALFYDLLFRGENGRPPHDLGQLAEAFEAVLTAPIAPEQIDLLASAPIIYFAGRDNGVAEELTLKTNEIARKKSDFLEGTYSLHGIEEVMTATEALVIIDPFPAQERAFSEVLGRGVGLPIVAIASRQTAFPTIQIPDWPEYAPYLHLAAGWNLLVEIGLRLAVDLDHPTRARKVGNAFRG